VSRRSLRLTPIPPHSPACEASRPDRPSVFEIGPSPPSAQNRRRSNLHQPDPMPQTLGGRSLDRHRSPGRNRRGGSVKDGAWAPHGPGARGRLSLSAPLAGRAVWLAHGYAARLAGILQYEGAMMNANLSRDGPVRVSARPATLRSEPLARNNLPRGSPPHRGATR
jgi:hypothetical protein